MVRHGWAMCLGCELPELWELRRILTSNEFRRAMSSVNQRHMSSELRVLPVSVLVALGDTVAVRRCETQDVRRMLAALKFKAKALWQSAFAKATRRALLAENSTCPWQKLEQNVVAGKLPQGHVRRLIASKLCKFTYLEGMYGV